jgi:hypothetical protein
MEMKIAKGDRGEEEGGGGRVKDGGQNKRGSKTEMTAVEGVFIP